MGSDRDRMWPVAAVRHGHCYRGVCTGENELLLVQDGSDQASHAPC